MPPPHYEKRSRLSTANDDDPTTPTTPAPAPPRPLFSQSFFAPENATARKVYFKTMIGGCIFIVLTIFSIFSIYWGGLWQTPVRNLNGWIVDFDGALIGKAVKDGLAIPSPQSKVSWTVVPPENFPGGIQDVERAVRDEKIWLMLVVNANATSRLTASYANPDTAYNGSSAVTVYGAEARNENAFRVLIRPSVQGQMTTLGMHFAQEAVGSLLTNNTGTRTASVTSILTTSPQTILSPLGYTIVNLLPFDKPVASAVTFVGLIYQLILTFFVVMISTAARDASGLGKSLSLRSLVLLRLTSAFVAYFFLALFYTLLSVAFQVDFTPKFGHAGIVVFWMLNWVGMLSVGLALESLITVLTARFIPFFLIMWIIVNDSVCIFPIEVMPIVFRYGYATPFYNLSRAVRCIIFKTKDTVGENFGILIAWIAISCITLPLLQWLVRRQDIRAAQASSSDGRATQGDHAIINATPGTTSIPKGLDKSSGIYNAGGNVHHASGDLDLEAEVRKLGLRTGRENREVGEVGVGLVRSRSGSESLSLSGSRTPGRSGEV